MKFHRGFRMTLGATAVCAMAVLGAAPAFAQFSSGSTGKDGALSFTTPGTVVFDPVAMGIDASGDNIFNFTTINIVSGVTVQLVAHKLREKPVVWLATGAQLPSPAPST